MARHLLRQHRTEIESGQIVSLPPKSKKHINVLENCERRVIITTTLACLQEEKGQIVTYWQPSENVNADDFLPCNICFGFFLKSELWRHQKLCMKTLHEQTESKKQRRVQRTASALLPYKGQASQRCSEVLNWMIIDDVSLEVKNDQQICEFGNRLLEKHSYDRSKDGC